MTVEVNIALCTNKYCTLNIYIVPVCQNRHFEPCLLLDPSHRECSNDMKTIKNICFLLGEENSQNNLVW